MKLRQTIATVLLVLITGFVVFAQSNQFSINESPLPAPTGMVNDYANIIDDTIQAQIEQKLRDFKAKTNPNIEMAVVTVKTTGERPIFDYTLAVARGWKIGDKGATNSSLLLLVAVDDKKYFTQVSGGLQDELPDGLVGQLQRQNLVPAFRAGNYGKGIGDLVDSYIRTIEQRGDGIQAAPTPTTVGGKEVSNKTLFCCCAIIIVIIILFIIFSSFGKKGGGSGGGGSSRGGGFGGPIIFWGGGGGGGSSDWGSSSSGGDSWGGFSGGGGGFDGGGAGGDW
ncbi:MAG: TPM domain-containing protein [Acidobacteriota bacterium]